MMTTFDAFSRKLMGDHHERFSRSAFACAVVYLALRTAEIQLTISPFILFLMSTAFTAGIMWQALSSKDNARDLAGMLVLPFENRKLVLSYVGALATYTLMTKTALLLAIVFAVGDWSLWQIAGALICAGNACLVTAACYALFQKKRTLSVLLWLAAEIAVIFAVEGVGVLLGVVAASIVLAVIVLCRTDAYAIYQEPAVRAAPRRSRKNGGVWVYLFRYLMAHKNYLANTLGLWAGACLLPYLFGQFQNLNALPLGFALLSLNTPICILLSCDPDLEQSVRALPGQVAGFCLPYCIFIFAFNLTASAVFLLSWQIQFGGVTGWAVLTAVLFALQSAILSVMLEWLHPLRNWKTESDLWHHPRKYVVPVVMIILAALVGSYPVLLAALLVILLLESAVLLSKTRRI